MGDYMSVNFYRRKGSNEIFYLNSSLNPEFFCSDKVEEILPNTIEASMEKHIPTFEINENTIKVSVGSVLHPMNDNHYISLIYLETEKGGQVKYLKPTDKPIAIFNIEEDKAISIYEYCTLHGLWKKEL